MPRWPRCWEPFPVVRRGDLNAPPNPDQTRPAATCATFWFRPLSHLGAAVIHVDRPVLVDMHQRARLVEMREREGNAEFHRRKGEAFLDDAVACVPVSRGLPPLGITRCLEQAVGHVVQDEILDDLTIGRGLFRSCSLRAGVLDQLFGPARGDVLLLHLAR